MRARAKEILEPGERPCTANDFERLEKSLGDERYILGGKAWPKGLARPASQLDRLAGLYLREGQGELQPFEDVLNDLKRFHVWARAYLEDDTHRSSEEAKVAISLALRLRLMGGFEVKTLSRTQPNSIVEVASPQETKNGRPGTDEKQEAELNLQEFPETSRQILSANHNPELEENWGTHHNKKRILSGVSHWAAGEVAATEADYRSKARALAIHLIQQISTRPAQDKHPDQPPELVIASPLFNSSTDPGFPDLLLAREFDRAIFHALRNGWSVTRVLSRGGANLTPEMQVEVVNILLLDLVTPGVYRPVVGAPATTPDAIVARRTASMSFVSNPMSVPWTPRSLTRAVQWGRSREKATKTVNGVWKDVSSVLNESESESAGQKGYVKKWTVRSDLQIPTQGVLAFDRTLTVSELIPGTRHILKAGFTTSTIPDDVSERQFDAWKHDLKKKAVAGVFTEGELERSSIEELEARIDRLQEKRRVRHFAFRTNSETHSYWDIMPLEALEGYASAEDPDSDDALYGSRFLTHQDRLEHLRNIQHHLKETARREAADGPTAPGYRLALAKESDSQNDHEHEEEVPFDLQRTWVILTASEDTHADQVHFVHLDSEVDKRVLAVLEASAMPIFRTRESFKALFDAIWDRIAQDRREPAAVARRIEKLIEREG